MATELRATRWTWGAMCVLCTDGAQWDVVAKDGPRILVERRGMRRMVVAPSGPVPPALVGHNGRKLARAWEG